eukprot:maker-scaffold_37-snap-gene-1.48-mRNA-1 protein AED:0.01 eAED:0.01 QI:47/1/1/1/1/1/2/27/370
MSVKNADTVLKWVSLVLMFLQNSATPLIFRKATTSSTGEDAYSVSAAVVMGELIKLLLSLCLVFGEVYFSIPNLFQKIYFDIIKKPKDTLKLFVPAILYFIQNVLLQKAVSNLPAALFQVTYQGKTLVVAFFSVFLLKKQLSRYKWSAILLMAIGIATVQLSKNTENSQSSMANAEEQSISLGLFYVLCGCFSSGFAGVYFEKMLKGTQNEVNAKKPSMWIRNIQLASFSILIGIFPVLFEGKQISFTNAFEKGYFLYGFNFNVWLMVVNNAIGGLCVAFVIKYADNILKGFACALATGVASIASVFLFGFQLSIQFFIGMIGVILSMLMYGNAIQITTFTNKNVDFWESEPEICMKIRGENYEKLKVIT